MGRVRDRSLRIPRQVDSRPWRLCVDPMGHSPRRTRQAFRPPQPACQGVLMQLFVSSLLSKRVDVGAELAGSWAPVITTVFLGAHHLLDQSQN